MKKLVTVAIVFATLGFVTGNAFWYLASPLWIDREVSETLNLTPQAVTLATGEFLGVDNVHQGKGQVNAISTNQQTILRFTEFDVTNGPDLYVWLVKSGDLKASGDVTQSEWLELGLLKGNVGDQNYELPAGTNIEDYGAVAIWCKQFGVLFASANLSAPE